MGFPEDWAWRWPIDIQASQVPGALSDWPTLLTELHVPAAAWAQMQESGADLRFSSDQAGTNLLSHQLVACSAAAQTLQAWVQVPAISAVDNTRIWAWCGNAGAVMPSKVEQDAAWPSEWQAVWHLEEASGNFDDATSKDNTATDYVSETGKAGQIGAGQEFDGSDDYATPTQTVTEPAAMTWMAWVYLHTYAPSSASPWFSARVIVQSKSAATTALHSLSVLGLDPNGTARWAVNWDATIPAGERISLTAPSALPLNTWVHLAGTAISNGACVLYQGGDPVANGSIAGAIRQGNLWQIGKGASATYAMYWDGNIDELTLINAALTATDIKAYHNMTGAPGTWAIAGALESTVAGISSPLLKTTQLGKDLFRGVN